LGRRLQEQDAAALVRHINITHNRCVRYWTFPNEADRYPPNDPDAVPVGVPKEAHIAGNIATYFKAYAIAMRDVDPTIVIVGPDLSYYDNTSLNGDVMSELLTGGSDICGSYPGANALLFGRRRLSHLSVSKR
jgi:hypothetical protein